MKKSEDYIKPAVARGVKAICKLTGHSPFSWQKTVKPLLKRQRLLFYDGRTPVVSLIVYHHVQIEKHKK